MQKNIRFSSILFFKDKEGKNSFFMIPKVEWNSNITEFCNSLPIILGFPLEDNVAFKSFWFGSNTWIDKTNDSLEVEHTNDLLVAVQESIANEGIEFYSAIIEMQPDLKKLIPDNSKNSADKPKIFIVHGHDEDSLIFIENLLRKVGGEPLYFKILDIEGSKTIIEILEENVKSADAILCLFSPDDEGRKKNSGDPLKSRVRENVLIESGYAILNNRSKSLIIAMGDVSIPTDFSGIHYIESKRLDDKLSLQLVKRLKEMGLNLDIAKI